MYWHQGKPYGSEHIAKVGGGDPKEIRKTERTAKAKQSVSEFMKQREENRKENLRRYPWLAEITDMYTDLPAGLPRILYVNSVGETYGQYVLSEKQAQIIKKNLEVPNGSI